MGWPCQNTHCKVLGLLCSEGVGWCRARQQRDKAVMSGTAPTGW